jgi:hypothetical protein
VDLTNTASEGSLQQARIWLRECSSRHNCGKLLPFPDIEPIRNPRPSRSAQPTSPDFASNPEPTTQSETKKVIDSRLLKWLGRRTPYFKGQGSHSRIRKLDDVRSQEPARSLELGQRPEATQSRDHSQSLEQNRSQKPKRLVDVRAFGEDSMDARLVENSTLQSRYEILSYCWGIQGNFTTTTDTLELRLSHINYSLIPATLQHAFKITQGFFAYSGNRLRSSSLSSAQDVLWRCCQPAGFALCWTGITIPWRSPWPAVFLDVFSMCRVRRVQRAHGRLIGRKGFDDRSCGPPTPVYCSWTLGPCLAPQAHETKAATTHQPHNSSRRQGACS